MTSARLLLVTTLLVALTSCTGQTGPDSHTEVFKTPEEATAARKARLINDWQQMAERIANAERPDIKTTKGQGFSLHLSADGTEGDIDLTPLSEKLASANGRERDPIRAYLAQKIPAFDRARLANMSFEHVKPMLIPQLHNDRQTQALAAPDTGKLPIANRVVIDLNWIPEIRWPSSSARTAVDVDMAAAWHVTPQAVSDAALENLRQSFSHRTQTPFETIDLPGMGRYGTLRAGVDPAILLLGDFLAAIRTEWKTTDDIVLFLPSPTSVNFIERKNEKLLNRMIPQWAALYAKVPDPMISSKILASDKGLSLLEYAPPSTAPATRPSPKPAPYIVH